MSHKKAASIFSFIFSLSWKKLEVKFQRSKRKIYIWSKKSKVWVKSWNDKGFKSSNYKVLEFQSEIEHAKKKQTEKSFSSVFPDQLDALRTQTDQERKMRASVAMKISENIAQERESLVKELDMLRSINTKVRQYFKLMVTWWVSDGSCSQKIQARNQFLSFHRMTFHFSSNLAVRSLTHLKSHKNLLVFHSKSQK